MNSYLCGFSPLLLRDFNNIFLSSAIYLVLIELWRSHITEDSPHHWSASMSRPMRIPFRASTETRFCYHKSITHSFHPSSFVCSYSISVVICIFPIFIHIYTYTPTCTSMLTCKSLTRRFAEKRRISVRGEQATWRKKKLRRQIVDRFMFRRRFGIYKSEKTNGKHKLTVRSLETINRSGKRRLILIMNCYQINERYAIGTFDG